MTPDDLRSLADAATQWQWHWDDDERMSVEFQTEGDRRLIALAPDLARLCAEYAGAFEQIAKLHPKDRAESTFIAQRALAKLSELESVT